MLLLLLNVDSKTEINTELAVYTEKFLSHERRHYIACGVCLLRIYRVRQKSRILQILSQCLAFFDKTLQLLFSVHTDIKCQILFNYLEM